MNNKTYQYGDQDRARRARIDFKQQLIHLNIDVSCLANEYPADMVWAASWAAFRLNEFKYVKDYDQTNPDQLMNRVRMIRLLEGIEEITSVDIEMGRQMREHNTRYTMIALKRDLNNFECMVAEAVNLNVIKVKPQPYFSVIASLAINYHRTLQYNSTTNKITDMNNSDHLAFEIGSNVRLNNVHIIRSRLSLKHYRYFTIANYCGNMISWWGSHTMVENATALISGSIIGYSTWESDNGPIKMTKLNYVRCIEYKSNT